MATSASIWKHTDHELEYVRYITLGLTAMIPSLNYIQDYIHFVDLGLNQFSLLPRLLFHGRKAA
jgi:hypothetical protein